MSWHREKTKEQKTIMANKFVPKAQFALNSALGFASDLGHTYIGSEHLLLGLLSTPDCAASKILNGRGVHINQVKDTVIEITGIGSPIAVSPSDMTPRTKKIIEGSAYESLKTNDTDIRTEHFLLLGKQKKLVQTLLVQSICCFPFSQTVTVLR